MEEVNALASFGCQVEPQHTGRKVSGARLYWWRKDVAGLREAFAERQRPKVGRRARLTGEIEDVVETPSLFGERLEDPRPDAGATG